eukprot:SAG11_NODE_12613_length_694_cov_1.700840_1_plen_44_part_10
MPDRSERSCLLRGRLSASGRGDLSFNSHTYTVITTNTQLVLFLL